MLIFITLNFLDAGAKVTGAPPPPNQAKSEMASITDRDPEEILAEYPGGKIKRKDLIEQIKATGMNVNTPQPVKVIDELEHRLALTIMFQTYITPIAKKEGIDKEMATLIEFLTKQVIYSQFLTKKAKALVTDEDIENVYEKQRREMKDEIMFNLSACIVRDEATAKAVIEAVRNKKTKEAQREEFVKQVMEKSILEETKRQQGALPPLTKARLPILFGQKNAEVVQKYGSNAIIRMPLKVKDSWFVVFVNNKSNVDETMKPYKEIKEEVDQLFRPQVERSKRIDVLKDIMNKGGSFKIKIGGEMKPVNDLSDNILTAAVS